MLAVVLIGFAFGFFGSIPVAGPIAALVLQRGLTGRHKAGAMIGLGCAIAEAAYALLSFWGFATLLARYPVIDPVTKAAAAVILIGLGLSFSRYKGAREGVAPPAESLARSFFLGFSITIVNPTLIATWTAATTTLAGTGLVTLDAGSAWPFGLGAFAGISGWFGLLSGLLYRYGGRFKQATLTRVVRGVGYAIALLGVFFAYRFAVWLFS